MEGRRFNELFFHRKPGFIALEQRKGSLHRGPAAEDARSAPEGHSTPRNPAWSSETGLIPSASPPPCWPKATGMDTAQSHPRAFPVGKPVQKHIQRLRVGIAPPWGRFSSVSICSLKAEFSSDGRVEAASSAWEWCPLGMLDPRQGRGAQSSRPRHSMAPQQHSSSLPSTLPTS